MPSDFESWKKLLFRRFLPPAMPSGEPELFLIVGSDVQALEIAGFCLARMLGPLWIKWSLDEVCRLHPDYSELKVGDPARLLQTIVPAAQQITAEGVLEGLRRGQSSIALLPISHAAADLDLVSQAGQWCKRVVGVTNLAEETPAVSESIPFKWAPAEGIVPCTDPAALIQALRGLGIVEWWHCGECSNPQAWDFQPQPPFAAGTWSSALPKLNNPPEPASGPIVSNHPRVSEERKRQRQELLKRIEQG